METAPCEDHPDELVRFVCLPCNRMICRDCKMADHEGHRTTDIRKTAEQARKDLSVMNSQLETGTHIIQAQLRDAEANIAQFDESVREARLELKGRAEAIIKWVEKFRDEALDKLKKLAVEGRKEQEEFIHSLHHKNKKISRFREELEEAQRTTSDLKILQADIRMKKHGPGEELSCGTLLKNAVKYRLHVGFTDTFRFDTHEKDIKSFLGKPVLAQVGKDSASTAMLNEFCCSKDPGLDVMAIHPLDNGKVCVACSDSGKDEHSVIVFDAEKQKSIAKEATSSEHKRSKIARTTTSSLSLYPVLSGSAPARPVSLDLDKLLTSEEDEYENQYKSVFVLKRSKRTGGGYKVCDETASPEESWRAPFKINVEDPVTICADSYGQHFAVIQYNREGGNITRTPSVNPAAPSRPQKPSVALFRRDQPNRFALFQPSVKGFRPSDICFHVVDNKEVLLVSDEANNVIYVVDFSAEYVLDGRVDKRGELGAGCPWLTAPTSMAVDKSGVLWVGCRGGHVLSCVPTDTMQLYHQPENTDDEPGYEGLQNVDEDSSAGNASCSDVSTSSDRGWDQQSDSEKSASGGSSSAANAPDNSVAKKSPPPVRPPTTMIVKQSSLTDELKNTLSSRATLRNTATLPKDNVGPTEDGTGYVRMTLPVSQESPQQEVKPDFPQFHQNGAGPQGNGRHPESDTLHSGPGLSLDSLVSGNAPPSVHRRGSESSDSSRGTRNVPDSPPPRPAKGIAHNQPPPPVEPPVTPPLPPRTRKFNPEASKETPEVQSEYSNYELPSAGGPSQAAEETEVTLKAPKKPETTKSPEQKRIATPAVALSQNEELAKKLAARLKKTDSEEESSAPAPPQQSPLPRGESQEAPQNPRSPGGLPPPQGPASKTGSPVQPPSRPPKPGAPPPKPLPKPKPKP
ncbi:hypothetical protein BaRGS_00017040 [Batillaria attramentaria]|uniref:B box-type domain-containing protein n=1 Tax=Batillaria attramentaria TaxID=370345 RepID=A0ABD0KY83_9CAEN